MTRVGRIATIHTYITTYISVHRYFLTLEEKEEKKNVSSPLMMKTEHVLQMLWYSNLLIRHYANKTSETKMAQMGALAVDSSGIAPHMGDDHGSLQSYVLYIHIRTEYLTH